jgi:outer membrane lipoprotein-sorting protein
MAKKINNRRVRVLLVALIILVLGLGQALTQDWSSILEQAEAKYAKFEKEVKDMTIVQEMKMVTPEEEMVSEIKMLKKGEKFRVETRMQAAETTEMPEEMKGMETVIIYDGKDTWMISSFMGKKKLSPEEGKEYLTERNWWEWELELVSEKGKIVGTEKVDKRECYVVEMEEEEESAFTKLWFDKKNLALIKYEVNGPEGETIALIHSDFRKIKGDWEMPYKTEFYTDDKLMFTSLIKSLELNTGLSDDLFDPNKVKIKGFNIREMQKKRIPEKEEEPEEEEE